MDIPRSFFYLEAVLARYPVGAGERHAGHRGCFDRQRAEVFRLEIVDMIFAQGGAIVCASRVITFR